MGQVNLKVMKFTICNNILCYVIVSCQYCIECAINVDSYALYNIIGSDKTRLGIMCFNGSYLSSQI
jgi:hypothetical protein